MVDKSNRPDDLIYDWTLASEKPSAPPRRVEFDDETLRDGCGKRKRSQCGKASGDQPFHVLLETRS